MRKRLEDSALPKARQGCTQGRSAALARADRPEVLRLAEAPAWVEAALAAVVRVAAEDSVVAEGLAAAVAVDDGDGMS